MNALALKALLMSIVTEIKFGQPLAPNAGPVKAEYKKLMGLPKNATNQVTLAHLLFTYYDNQMLVSAVKTLKKLKAYNSKFIDKETFDQLFQRKA